MQRKGPVDLPVCPGRAGWPWTPPEAPPKAAHPRAQPGITVITPSFQQGGFIEETIRSVLMQDHPNVEYLVFDAGSTDGTVALLEKYAPWIAHWESQPDKGQADAINRGLERATGGIVAYLNSDDLYLPGAFSAVAAEFERTGCAWLASDTLQGDRIDGAVPWHAAATGLPEFLAKQTVPQQGVFWRREAAEGIRFPVERRYILDHVFFSRLFERHGPPHILRHTTSFFRDHPGSKSAQLQEVCDREHAGFIGTLWDGADDALKRAAAAAEARRLARARLGRLMDAPRDGPPKWPDRVATATRLLLTTPGGWRDRFLLSGWARTVAGRTGGRA